MPQLLACRVDRPAELAPDQAVDQPIAGAVQPARRASRWQERRAEGPRRGQRDHAGADDRHSAAFAHAHADKGRQATGQNRIAAFCGRIGLAHPAADMLQRHPRQTGTGGGNTVATRHQGDHFVMDVALKGHVGHIQGLRAAQGAAIGQQCDLVACADQPMAEHGQRARIAFGSVGQGQQPHGKLRSDPGQYAGWRAPGPAGSAAACG